jgi:hypothetical protein
MVARIANSVTTDCSDSLDTRPPLKVPGGQGKRLVSDDLPVTRERAPRAVVGLADSSQAGVE